MEPRHRFELQVSGSKVLLGERTLVMGVLNVTPDSFSDGGRYFDPVCAFQRGVELAREGADWIDVGGESTRPGSQAITVEEELRRVLPVIRGLRGKLRSVPISIDTTKAEVAREALAAGANILNDVSGLRFDRRLADVARSSSVPLILMHLRGRPESMQREPFARDIWRSVMGGLETSLQRALAAGVRRAQIILDPGFGFGKSRRQNYEILAGLARLQRFRLPILVGSSRKSFVQAAVEGEGLEPSRARRRRDLHAPVEVPDGPACRHRNAPLVSGDVAVVVAAILGGAHIVRVHDPDAILPAVRIADTLLTVLNRLRPTPFGLAK
jgi:dihydropteroate synthase